MLFLLDFWYLHEISTVLKYEAHRSSVSKVIDSDISDYLNASKGFSLNNFGSERVN